MRKERQHEKHNKPIAALPGQPLAGGEMLCVAFINRWISDRGVK